LSISDFNKTKKLEVASVSGTPTVDKAQPIYLTSGDDSTTGTGEVVLDWTNINGPSDIALYDQDGNLLYYEIEELNVSNKTGLIWVYNSWVRDGTVQAQIAYGDGPTDQQDSGNTWASDNLKCGYQFSESPIQANDISSNGNNGSVYGAGSASGMFNGGASFDGTDDVVQTPINPIIDDGPLTFLIYFYAYSLDGSDTLMGYYTNNAVSLRLENDNSVSWFTYNGNTYGLTNEGSFQLNEWNQVVGTWDGVDTYKLFLNGSKVGEKTNSTLQTNGAGVDDGSDDYHCAIGARRNTGSFEWYTDADLDEPRIFDGDCKTKEWILSDYDASSLAGQIFFDQNAAESTPEPAAGSVAQADQSGVTQTDDSGVISTE
jgi:hypothetical protein